MSELRTGLPQQNDPNAIMQRAAAAAQPANGNVVPFPQQPTPPAGGAGGGAAAPDVRSQAIQWWVQNGGVTPAVAQGIATQINKESGFDPTLPGDNGTSIGLYQAHDDRKQSLMQRADWQNPVVQHQWALSQVTGGDPVATAHWNEIKAAKTPAEASRLWQQYFERPAGSAGAGHEQYISSGREQLTKVGEQMQKLVDQLSKEGGRSKETWDQLRQAQAKMAEYEEKSLELAKNPPSPNPRDTFERLGGLATVVGILGGLLTKQPLMASLNAGRAAMEAYNKGDEKTYEYQRDNWKRQNDITLKLAQFQHEQIRDILYDENMQAGQRMNLLNATLSALGHEQQAALAQVGDERALRQWASQMDQANRQFAMQMARFDKSERDAEKRGWQVLTDPGKKDEQGNLVQYRYNPGTGEATTLDLQPYTPTGAAKMGSSSATGTQHFTEQDVDYWARVLNSGGHLPPGLARTAAGSDFVQRVMAKMPGQQGGDPGSFIANASTVKADTSSLNNMTKMADAATSFERTASKNFDLALTLSKDAIPTDWGPWINKWIETGETQAGNTDVPPYVTAMLTGANEYAKIMSGSTGAQGSTVDSRREAAELFSPYLSKGQIERVVAVAKADMGNRKQSLYGQIDDIKSRLHAAGSGEPTATQGQGKSAIGQPGNSYENPIVPKTSDEYLALPKGTWYTDQDGKTYQKASDAVH